MIALIFGPPGSGKGTQAAAVAAGFGLVHVSTGEILRAEAERGTPLGEEVRPIMERGQLVPDELIVRVIESRLAHPDAGAGVLLDGFPRTVPQARALDEMLRRTGRRVDLVLCLEVPTGEVVRRILGRAGEEGRADDTPETIEERLAEYRSKTAPVLDHYREVGARVEMVDGVGEVAEVSDRVRAVFAQTSSGVRGEVR